MKRESRRKGARENEKERKTDVARCGGYAETDVEARVSQHAVGERSGVTTGSCSCSERDVRESEPLNLPPPLTDGGGALSLLLLPAPQTPPPPKQRGPSSAPHTTLPIRS